MSEQIARMSVRLAGFVICICSLLCSFAAFSQESESCDTDARCGRSCVDCKTFTNGERPYCFDGVCIECKQDSHCSAGKFCWSGYCVDCTVDRHCGPKCSACGTDSRGTKNQYAFCQRGKSVEDSRCVGCIGDWQCPDGLSCDSASDTCVISKTCNCNNNMVCSNGDCLQCLSSSQCLIGQYCKNGTCVNGCERGADCGPNESCFRSDNSCNPGTSRPGLTAIGGALHCAFGRQNSSPRSEVISLSAVLVFLGVRAFMRRRKSRI